ncbi:hypothetical protein BDF19DRAFT_158980 [Syncephalis fuscata]|nr:hypothetical protein BDF19DRAFT_158980 [Syncephalis fuscata]
MSPIIAPTNHECRLLLEVLLTEDHAAAVGTTQAPLSLEDFQTYLQDNSDKSLEHCLEFLQWLVDYTVRFSRLSLDLQRRSPAVRGDRVEMSAVKPTIPGIRYGLSPPGKQPFRSAADFCQLRFLNPGAPLDLRMPLGIRDSCLTLLGRTTHPSAFASVADHCRRRLASEALPNYVAVSCRNLNKRSVSVRNAWCIFGIVLVLMATLSGLLLEWSRWIRFALLPLIVYVIFTLAGSRVSLCAIRHLKGIRDEAGYRNSFAKKPMEEIEKSPLEDVNLRKRESVVCSPTLETVQEVNESDEEKSIADEANRPSSPAEAKISLDGETKYSGSIHRLSSATTRLPSLEYVDSYADIPISNDPPECGWMFWKRDQQVHPIASLEQGTSFGKMPYNTYKGVVRSSLVRRLQRRQLIRNIIPMTIVGTLMTLTALLSIPESIFN